MYLLGLALILLLLKWQAIGPFENLSWWWIVGAFAATAVWWELADWSGYTKRRQVDKEDQRKLARINRQRKALGRKEIDHLPGRGR